VSLSVHWFLPTGGDGRGVTGFGADSGGRRPDLDYLSLVARAAEQAGFDAVLTPTGTWCEDAWLATAALVRDTSRLRFLVAFRPGFIGATGRQLPAPVLRPPAPQRRDGGPGR
jgi:alkanesulfonate monooxygenase